MPPMKKIPIVTVFFLLLVFFTSCSTDSVNQNLLNGKLTIVYSGNIGGEINPCGCRIPLGGFARRSTVINEIRKETSNVLILDSGALLYPKYYIYPPYDYYLRIRAHLLKDVMTEIGIDAFNVGSYDLADGPDSLLAFDASVPGTWLSSNIVWNDSGELVFRPDKVITVGNIRIGVFGFMDQKSMGNDIFKEDAPVKVLDPVETVRTEVAKLKPECDIIVALAYMDLDHVKKLVEKVSGIHIVFVSHTRGHRPNSDFQDFKPVQVNNTIIARCPDGGRVLGRLDLEIVNGSTEFVKHSRQIDLIPVSQREKEKIFEGSNYRNTFVELGTKIKSDAKVKEKIDIAEALAKADLDS